MDSIFRKGLFLVTFAGAITMSSVTVQASEIESAAIMPGIGIEEVLNDCYTSDKDIEVADYLVPTEKGEYLDMAFADVETSLYIRSEPTKASEWIGRLYPDYAAEILGPVGEWTKIKSGDVTGYVYSDYIIIGNEAQEKAEQILAEDEFQYAVSRAVEEEEKQKEAAGNGQAVVNYACQFIGNPYVWGGTSLTNGADCSGFVQSVYKHFGISLPRTSAQMRSAGRAVNYSEAIAGDIICYDGHVGIYMGDGQIVNAINSRRGIGILSATYDNIITVRRLL